MNPTKISQFDPNLVLWLRMQEGPNPVAFDYSGASNHGIIYGATWSSPGLYFDGVGDYVNAGNNASLNIINNISISAWIKTSNTSQDIIFKGVQASNRRDYNLFVSFSAARFSICNDGLIGTNTTAIGTTNISSNIWVFVSAIYDGSNIKIYINGKIDVTEPKTGNIYQNTDSVIIGKTNIAGYFDGSIDDVRVHNRALLINEIDSIFQSTRNKYGV